MDPNKITGPDVMMLMIATAPYAEASQALATAPFQSDEAKAIAERIRVGTAEVFAKVLTEDLGQTLPEEVRDALTAATKRVQS